MVIDPGDAVDDDPSPALEDAPRRSRSCVTHCPLGPRRARSPRLAEVNGGPGGDVCGGCAALVDGRERADGGHDLDARARGAARRPAAARGRRGELLGASARSRSSRRRAIHAGLDLPVLRRRRRALVRRRHAVFRRAAMGRTDFEGGSLDEDASRLLRRQAFAGIPDDVIVLSRPRSPRSTMGYAKRALNRAPALGRRDAREQFSNARQVSPCAPPGVSSILPSCVACARDSSVAQRQSPRLLIELL